ncbi:uncharacterized protein DS421_5g167800 [Arachis hypogaea]|nr:uncharacterized protein DS421_5g167800 [Arachis hypogaea]
MLPVASSVPFSVAAAASTNPPPPPNSRHRLCGCLHARSERHPCPPSSLTFLVAALFAAVPPPFTVFFPPCVVKPKGTVKSGPILLVVARSSSSPDLSSSSSSPRVPPLPPNVSVTRRRECLLSPVLLAVANVPVLLTVVPVPPEASFLQQEVHLRLRQQHLQLPPYCVVADEFVGRQVPIAFLELNVKIEVGQLLVNLFFLGFSWGRGCTLLASPLSRSDSATLLSHGLTQPLSSFLSSSSSLTPSLPSLWPLNEHTEERREENSNAAWRKHRSSPFWSPFFNVQPPPPSALLQLWLNVTVVRRASASFLVKLLPLFFGRALFCSFWPTLVLPLFELLSLLFSLCSAAFQPPFCRCSAISVAS